MTEVTRTRLYVFEKTNVDILLHKFLHKFLNTILFVSVFHINFNLQSNSVINFLIIHKLNLFHLTISLYNGFPFQGHKIEPR